jgi:hypothetical protein
MRVDADGVGTVTADLGEFARIAAIPTPARRTPAGGLAVASPREATANSLTLVAVADGHFVLAPGLTGVAP